jgi:diadenosine tetraphosphate (Ap4A) HIT family hydrolase
LEECPLTNFALDPRLESDSIGIAPIGLCELRLSKDSRWPWLILIPRRAEMTEIFELTPLDQVLLTFEVEMVAAALKKITGATKINVGALGNVVRQLHVHVVARFEGDANWPGPIWGFGTAEPYEDGKRDQFIATLREALSP